MSTRYLLFVAGTLLLTALIGYGTYNTTKLLQSWRPDRNLLLVPAENLLRLALIVLCGGLGWLSGLPPAQLGWTAAKLPAQGLWGLWWGLVLALFFYATTRWLARRTGSRFYSDAIVQMVLPEDRRQTVQVALALIGVALSEELLFRSLLLGGLEPLLPVRILLPALGLLFGLMHAPQGVWGMTGAAFAGMLFGALFLHAGSLLLPLIAHYVANLVQVLLALRERGFQTLEERAER